MRLIGEALCKTLRELLVSDSRCLKAVGLGNVPTLVLQGEHGQMREGSAEGVPGDVEQVVWGARGIEATANFIDGIDDLLPHILPDGVEARVDFAAFAVIEICRGDLPELEIPNPIFYVVGPSEGHEAAVLVLQLAHD